MSEPASKPAEYSYLYRPQPAFRDAPFDSSAFDYRPFAERVIQTFQLLGHGAVIAIDAPWGHGKTFFGRNLDAQLSGQGWKTTYIDAFQHDFVEDPFLLLAGAIKDRAKTAARRSFVKAASAVGKTLLPITAKVVAKIATAGVLDEDAVEDLRKATTDASGDAAAKLVENRIAEFEKDKQTIASFREAIASLAQTVYEESGHPVVVFIDELDRCRPDFAVRSLERMKHFFDVPHLIFVLLLNKPQLESAVNGVYGAAIDAEMYLRKFIHVTLQLPIRTTTSSERRNEVGQYPGFLATRIDLGEHQPLVQPFAKAMAELAPALRLSFRDVERCFTVFVVGTLKVQIAPDFMSYLGFIVALNVAFPDVYEGLIQKQDEARTEVGKLLNAAQGRGLAPYYTASVMAMIDAHFGKKLGAEELQKWQQFLFRFHIDVERFFGLLASLFDSRIVR